ncbi:Bacterial nucleoid DNA-binding protein [Methylacidimicrobium sp. AP8]|uniref:HU family DNA-binding protein n=1 Tax=Methylacidimicrobium sp. AP8 TaxID=2730359 RepID=UPI0018C0F972|nr:HU family DNA-binding protein [Methylacidimicrobium sp. AP8]CAB4244556.1 Bacterial nucleoid DNA-binding protein [Methylacidimicrobium sp. AP8]
MGNLTRRDLVVQVAEETNLPQQQAAKVLGSLLRILMESFANRQNIELRNFGVFEIALRRARVGRNPRSPGRDITIPPRAVIRFKPGKQVKRILQKVTQELLEEESGKKSSP